MAEDSKKLRIWLDDERPMPHGFDHHARTTGEVIKLIRKGNVEFISLDNDLGIGYAEGKTVAQYIEKMVLGGRMQYVDFHPHTANPVAWDEIMACKRACQRYRPKDA